jgi:hypothetical protein
MVSARSVVTFSTFVYGIAIAQTCYYPDGSVVNHPDFKPCHAGRTSMCCATNRTGPDVNSCEGDDTCLQQDSQTFWRESCTDPNWGPGCLQLCRSGMSMEIPSFIKVIVISSRNGLNSIRQWFTSLQARLDGLLRLETSSTL